MIGQSYHPLCRYAMILTAWYHVRLTPSRISFVNDDRHHEQIHTKEGDHTPIRSCLQYSILSHHGDQGLRASQYHHITQQGTSDNGAYGPLRYLPIVDILEQPEFTIHTDMTPMDPL